MWEKHCIERVDSGNKKDFVLIYSLVPHNDDNK